MTLFKPLIDTLGAKNMLTWSLYWVFSHFGADEAYYIMHRYGNSLQNLLEKQKLNFSTKTILHIGIKLLGIYEKIHDAGYTHNDLKLENKVLVL